MPFRNIAQPQLDRIEPEFIGQFVHRGFERERAIGLAGRAHIRRRRRVDAQDGVACFEVSAFVNDLGHFANGPHKGVVDGRLRCGVLANCRQFTACVHAELDALMRGGPASVARCICARESTRRNGLFRVWAAIAASTV